MATPKTSGWDVVRVKAANGDHYTTTRVLALKAGESILEDKPAVDRYGNWLPRKVNINPAPKKSASTTTKKEG